MNPFIARFRALRRFPGSGGGRHAGQAVTEFLAIAAVVIPLFLLVPLIAKYQDIAFATQIAARYLAFEATIRNAQATGGWKPPAQLAAEVRRRFLGMSDAPIKTGDTAGNFKAHQNPFWRDPKDNALIENFDKDVQVSFGPGKHPNHAGGFAAASDGIPFSSPTGLGLEASGIYSANVSVTLAAMPADLNSLVTSYAEFKNLRLQVTRLTGLLVNPWTASGPGEVEDRINNWTAFAAGKMLAPTRLALDPIVGLVEQPKYAPAGCLADCGPKLGQLDFWSDVVPADRLK